MFLYLSFYAFNYTQTKRPSYYIDTLLVDDETEKMSTLSWKNVLWPGLLNADRIIFR